jgi:hypothetical protein
MGMPHTGDPRSLPTHAVPLPALSNLSYNRTACHGLKTTIHKTQTGLVRLKVNAYTNGGMPHTLETLEIRPPFRPLRPAQSSL